MNGPALCVRRPKTHTARGRLCFFGLRRLDAAFIGGGSTPPSDGRLLRPRRLRFEDTDVNRSEPAPRQAAASESGARQRQWFRGLPSHLELLFSRHSHRLLWRSLPYLRLEHIICSSRSARFADFVSDMLPRLGCRSHAFGRAGWPLTNSDIPQLSGRTAAALQKVLFVRPNLIFRGRPQRLTDACLLATVLLRVMPGMILDIRNNALFRGR